jgi:carboxylesterase type B
MICWEETLHAKELMIPDYTLSPNTDDGMAKQIAAVIQWTKDSISKFNGNPNEVFITGHSGTLGRIGRYES